METIIFLNNVEAMQKGSDGKITILLTSGQKLDIHDDVWTKIKVAIGKIKLETFVFGVDE